jgi:hypothetical protein
MFKFLRSSRTRPAALPAVSSFVIGPETELLAAAILDYGRMIAEYALVRTPHVKVSEIARRFAEEPEAILCALQLLQSRGQASHGTHRRHWELCILPNDSESKEATRREPKPASSV